MSVHKTNFRPKNSDPDSWSAVETEAAFLDIVRNGFNALTTQFLSRIHRRIRQTDDREEKKHYRMVVRKAAYLAQHLENASMARQLGQAASAIGAGVIPRSDPGRSVLAQAQMFEAISQGNLLKTQQSYHRMIRADKQEAADKGFALACHYGNDSAAEFFLKQGAAMRYDADRIVAWLADGGRMDMLKTLLKAQNKDVRDVLDAAMQATVTGKGSAEQRIDMLRYLQGAGADIRRNNDFLLYQAVMQGQQGMAVYLMENGADPDRACDAHVRGYNERSNERFAPYLAMQEEKYRKSFDAEFFNGFTLKDVRRIVDRKSGMTGLGLAVRAGKAEDVFAALQADGQTLTYSDIEKIGTDGKDGIKLLERRGQLSAIFKAELWQADTKGLERLWQKLDDKKREEISLKKLFSEVKKRNMRDYVRQRGGALRRGQKRRP